MISTRQPIRTTILHIRSKDSNQIDPLLNTVFSVQLASAIEATQYQEIHAQVISAEIPNSAYNISSAVKNDTIVYNTTETLTLPPKNYNPTELLRVINDDSSFPFTATRDRFTNKITFTNNTETGVVINWTSSLANKLLGFGEAPDQTVYDGGTTTSPGMLDLATIHSIFIKSDLASGNVLSTRAGQSTTLQKISIDVNGFGIIYLNQQDFRTVSVLQTPNISYITFRLTDQNDNLLDLNDINYEFSIQFMIFDRPSNERRTIQQQPEQQRPQQRPIPIIQQQPNPSPMVSSNSIEIVDEITADETHPIQGKTDIEHVAEKTILDNIIDNL